MKHEQVQSQPLSSPRVEVSTATKDEIVRLFEWLNFNDKYGHPLTMCQDFHDLLTRINFDNEVHNPQGLTPFINLNQTALTPVGVDAFVV